MLKIKKEFKGRTFHVQNRLGTTVMFDGTKDYDQNQLAKLKRNKYFENFIEESNIEEIVKEETVGDFTFVHTVKLCETCKNKIKECSCSKEEDVLEKVENEVKKYSEETKIAPKKTAAKKTTTPKKK